MNETITISLDEYKSLLRQAERVAAVERLFASVKYVTVGDIKCVLAIRAEKEAENGAN